jgi:hypothetical protein
VVEHSAYRYWDHWLSDGRVLHVFTVDIESGKVRDLFAGTRYELVKADPSADSYDISPTAARSRSPSTPPRTSASTTSTDRGAGSRRKRFRTLTAGSRLNHEAPRYSPDGRWLALLTQDLAKSHIAPTVWRSSTADGSSRS